MAVGFWLPVQIIQSTNSAANTLVWSMRNLGGTTITIQRIYLVHSFNGTAAATTSRYDIVRFRDATPTGGTALTVVKRDTASAASGVTDARFLDTGLTVASVTFDTAAAHVGGARQNGSASVFDLDLVHIRRDLATDEGIVLANNDGLGLRLGVAAVAGDSLTGFVQWLE